MADLKIPKRGISDRFNLQDFKDDFNALNEEKATKDELNELKTNGRVGELVVGNEALRIYQANNNDVEMYSNLDILSLGVMNKSGTNTVGFCVEPTDIANGFQVRPYNGQYMNIGATVDSYKINDVYAKGEIQAEKFTVMNGNTPIIEIKEPYSGDSEIKSNNRFVSLLAEDANIGVGAGFCLEQTSSSKGVVRPYGGHSIDLGTYNNMFNDIWLNGFDRSSNGYTKLPNGLILQWGQTPVFGTSGYTVLFPISFPNSTLTISVTPYTKNAFYSEAECKVGTKDEYAFNVWGNVDQRALWIAIGY